MLLRFGPAGVKNTFVVPNVDNYLGFLDKIRFAFYRRDLARYFPFSEVASLFEVDFEITDCTDNINKQANKCYLPVRNRKCSAMCMFAMSI